MTPSLRLLSYAAKMMLKHSSIVLGLSLFAVWPTVVLSINQDYLHEYLLKGVVRIEQDRFKRDVLQQRTTLDDEIKSAVETAESITQHLSLYEALLHGRGLMALEGSPSHTAMLASWADDNAVEVARRGYVNARASHLMAYYLCMKNRKPSEVCGEQLIKLSKPTPIMLECPPNKYRTFNGTCNNEMHPTWGSALSPYGRLLPANYRDGVWEPKTKELSSRSNAAEVSNAVLKQAGSTLKDVTLAVAAWANLVAYDMSHTVSNRMFSNGDPVMCCQDTHWKLAPRHRHPLCMPVVDRKETKCYNYVRSMLAPSEDYRFGPAQQMNAASHFLDGSGIYGTTEEMSNALRTGSNGQIHVSNVDGHKSLPQLFSSSSDTSLLPGEVRLNTDVVSAVLHSILLKEHNRIAAKLAELNKHWDDERTFQEARRIVIAELQHVTYNEWLPVVLGEKDVLKKGLHIPKTGFSEVYNENIRPYVANSFANAAMRFIVSLFDEQLNLYDEGRVLSGQIALRFSLIKPAMLGDKKTFNSIVRSLATQICQAKDLSLPDAVTKYLYSATNETGFDALSLDIQRGRDHGLPPYVAFRKLYGLQYQTFEDLASHIPKDILNSLRKAYDRVSDIDLIVGGLAEIPKKGSLLGPVFSNIISQQLVASRVGDRYFYDNKNQPYPFTSEQLAEIRKVTLARLLCDNSSLKKMQPLAFHRPNSSRNNLVNCHDTGLIQRLDLSLWKDESS